MKLASDGSVISTGHANTTDADKMKDLFAPLLSQIGDGPTNNSGPSGKVGRAAAAKRGRGVRK